MNNWPYTTIKDVRTDEKLKKNCLATAVAVALGDGEDINEGDIADITFAVREVIFEEVVGPLLEVLETLRNTFPLYGVCQSRGDGHIWHVWLPRAQAAQRIVTEREQFFGGRIIQGDGLERDAYHEERTALDGEILNILQKQAQPA